jgi:hypothetical protein
MNGASNFDEDGNEAVELLFKISAFNYISYCLLQGITSAVIRA